jgi:predicted site-specific integrase-resolvase
MKELHDRWLSKREAAKIAGVSQKTIDRFIRRGLLRRAECKVRRVLIAHSDLVKCMSGGQMRGAW